MVVGVYLKEKNGKESHSSKYLMSLNEFCLLTLFETYQFHSNQIRHFQIRLPKPSCDPVLTCEGTIRSDLDKSRRL